MSSIDPPIFPPFNASTFAALGGTGQTMPGGSVETLTASGAARNILDDGSGNMSVGQLQLSPPAAPTVTPEGTTGATSWSYEVVASNTLGSTTPSPAGSTTTGNATLSTTDYNLVSWPAVPLPAGSPGNLVYDSNLTNAIATIGPTWTPINGATIGTANGDFNVLNPGTDSAEWVYYGTGAAEAEQFVLSTGIPATPGATYTLSALLNGVAMTTGSAMSISVWQGAPPNLIVGITAFFINGGESGEQHTSFMIPAGVTEIFLALGINYNVGGKTSGTTVVPAGETISWSQIQVTETSTVQPYVPGPLFTYDVYRDVSGTYESIGSTTALAFQDTGQATNGDTPPVVNTTGSGGAVNANFVSCTDLLTLSNGSVQIGSTASEGTITSTTPAIHVTGSAGTGLSIGSDVTADSGVHIQPSWSTPTLPANPLVSGDVYQNTSGGPIFLTVPLTSTAAGQTAQWALGSTSTPPNWGGAETISSSGEVRNVSILVPQSWYFSLTTAATIGTASVLGM